MTFAVGFPAGGAAMYGAQHGLDLETAFALNNVRIFGYFLSLMLLGGSTLGFAVAALADRVHPRWFGGFGVVTGVALLASTPLAGDRPAGLGQPGVDGLVRRRRRADAAPPRRAGRRPPDSHAQDVAIGHS